MLDEDAHLIDLIYAAMLGEQPWENFLARLAETTPGGWSMLFSFDGRRPNQVISLLQGRSTDTSDQLERHYGTLNPFAPYCMVKPLGVGIPGERMVSRDRLEGTEFFNDFMVKQDTQATCGIAVDRSTDRTILISTMTRTNDEAEQRRLSAQYTRLAPHLRRAANFYRRTAPGRMVTELGGSMFDAVDIGVLLVTHDLRLVSMSAAAERLAKHHRLFDAAGRVKLPGEAAQAALKAMGNRRYHDAQTLQFSAAGLRLTLVKISRGGVIGLFDDCGVAVLVQPKAGLSSLMDLEDASKAYALTGAELRALDGLVKGLTVSEIARSAGRSVETVRTQVKSVYAKMGCSGRVEVLRRLTGLGDHEDTRM